eukprot:4808009-Prorocentrum_lima.AAC.1
MRKLPHQGSVSFLDGDGCCFVLDHRTLEKAQVPVAVQPESISFDDAGFGFLTQVGGPRLPLESIFAQSCWEQGDGTIMVKNGSTGVLTPLRELQRKHQDIWNQKDLGLLDDYKLEGEGCARTLLNSWPRWSKVLQIVGCGSSHLQKAA